MASVKQRPSGTWQAKVRRLGFPDQSKTFARKTDAEAWARAVEREMDVGSFVSRNKAENTTFGEAVDRYLAEVVPKLRAQRQPTSMLLKLKERFGEYSLVAIQPSMLAAYRDERLRAVGPQTVTHELGLVKLRQSAIGTHVLGGPEDPLGVRTVRVLDADVMVQPLGALMNYGMANKGAGLRGWSLVVDVGGGTIDYLVSLEREPNHTRSGAHPESMLQCAYAVAQQINPSYR